MKLTVLLENPDGLGDAIREAAGLPVPENVTGEERTERILSALERVAQYRQTISAWVEENGLIRLELDLGADPPTARVLRRDGTEEVGGCSPRPRLPRSGGGPNVEGKGQGPGKEA